MDNLEGGEVEPVQQIDVYIEQVWSGNFASGTGKFSIVLELKKDGQLYTKEHFKGYKGTSKNRLPILACIEMLKCMKVPCEIKAHIDSPYMTGAMPFLDGWKKDLKSHKNADLWEKYIELAEPHTIEFIQEKHNEYSPAMKVQIEVKEILLIEDYRPEDQI